MTDKPKKSYLDTDGLDYMMKQLVDKLKAGSSACAGPSDAMIILSQLLSYKQMVDATQNKKILMLAKEVMKLKKYVAVLWKKDHPPTTTPEPPPPTHPTEPPSGGDHSCDCDEIESITNAEIDEILNGLGLG